MTPKQKREQRPDSCKTTVSQGPLLPQMQAGPSRHLRTRGPDRQAMRGRVGQLNRQGRPAPGADATSSPCPRTVCVSVLIPPLVRTPVLGDWDTPGTSSYLEHLFRDPLSKHSPT